MDRGKRVREIRRIVCSTWKIGLETETAKEMFTDLDRLGDVSATLLHDTLTAFLDSIEEWQNKEVKTVVGVKRYIRSGFLNFLNNEIPLDELKLPGEKGEGE